ncbi:MAG TPA: diacylglycerol kinase family protein, partial [Candidatus Elarobacter sp.]|nr:diacylglycerol kinase family protein [Candidatus Elarobacter sp.]
MSPSPRSAEPRDRPAPGSAAPPRRHSLAAAFGYAFAGLAAAWRTQRNLRIHAVLALAVVIAGVLLRLPPLGWAVVALAIGLVLAAELLNTALEAVVDLVSPDDHPLAKRAKDVAAAGVLAASLAALAAGAFVLVAALGS